MLTHVEDQDHAQHPDAGDAGGADGAEHGDEEDDHLAGDVEFDAGQTGDEKCGGSFVKRRSIHIDRGAERYDEIGDVLLHVEMLLGTAQGHGQRRGARTGGKSGDLRFARAFEEMDRGDSGE